MEMIAESCKTTWKLVQDGATGVGGLVWSKMDKKALMPAAVPPPPVPVAQTGLLRIANVFGSSTSPWIRIAGLSGAIAVSMGAYGAHGLKKVPEDQRLVFETANKYHFIHSLALLAVPLTHRPNTVGSLLVLGCLLFSGSCYCHGMTGDNNIIRVTPFGGLTLILAWLAMVF